MIEVSPSEREAALSRFVARFDRSEYWQAHEELESLWLIERLDGYKGLIHLAAGLLHLQRDNRRGAITKLRSGLELLTDSPPQLAWFDLSAVRRRFRSLLRILEAGREPAATLASIRLGPMCRLAISRAQVPDESLPYRVTRYDDGYETGRDPRRRD